MKRIKFLRNVLLGGAILAVNPKILFAKNKNNNLLIFGDLLFSENGENFLFWHYTKEGKLTGLINFYSKFGGKEPQRVVLDSFDHKWLIKPTKVENIAGYDSDIVFQEYLKPDDCPYLWSKQEEASFFKN